PCCVNTEQSPATPATARGTNQLAQRDHVTSQGLEFHRLLRIKEEKRKSRAERKVCESVLEHFNNQYTLELGEVWLSAREVLLNPHCWQYGVLLNRFSDHLDVTAVLKSLGYYSLLSQPDPPNTRPLQCLVHKDAARLPTQRHREGWLKQYYLMNAASLLPVLALDVKDGERVLDLCSAPGGKALAVLQTANPGLLHCNEVDKSRYAWLVKTLESYIPHTLRDTVTVTNEDGRDIGLTKLEMFDKVLVDAPCSNDRSWLFSPGAQQGELRLRERAKLPQLQKELICSALSAVRPGGIVVYSTCTFSSAENHFVVLRTWGESCVTKPVTFKFLNKNTRTMGLHYSAPEETLEKPWRTMEWSDSNRDEMKWFLIHFKPKSRVKHLRILLIGPVGSGKSSFINSVKTALLSRQVCDAAVDAYGGTSFTMKYTTYKVKKGEDDLFPFVFNDIMGLEEASNTVQHSEKGMKEVAPKGVQISDIISAIQGHVPEGYTFDPENELTSECNEYVHNPSLDEKVHCLVHVLPGDRITLMADNIIVKMRTIREKARDLGIPEVVVMSMVDKACPMVSGDLEKMDRSRKINAKVNLLALLAFDDEQ
ncbi:tRNA (cytosine(34)-C(5))-methyltransferase, mitochondrial, partial [Clarias magur]